MTSGHDIEDVSFISSARARTRQCVYVCVCGWDVATREPRVCVGSVSVGDCLLLQT